MRLVVCCTLDAAEREAIQEGYDLRAALEQQLAAADLTPPDEQARQGLELLAWMVANGYLDVKVAVPVDAVGRPARVPGIACGRGAGGVREVVGEPLAWDAGLRVSGSALAEAPGVSSER
jgi:hypothetical protein